MKKFKKDSPHFHHDEKLVTCLSNIKNDIEIIIETGTFDGMGSTTMISDIFEDSNSLLKFYTIEVDNRIYLRARRNLKKYNFVECLNGLSINYKDCLSFMSNDEYIKNYNEIDYLYGDDVLNDDAYLTYSMELEGRIWNINSNVPLSEFDEDLLTLKIKENLDKKLLIVLDSSGGIGYLEFSTTIELLKDKEYYLLLDDINHPKHHRSYLYIKDNKDYEILEMNYDNGYLFCKKILK